MALSSRDLPILCLSRTNKTPRLKLQLGHTLAIRGKSVPRRWAQPKIPPALPRAEPYGQGPVSVEAPSNSLSRANADELVPLARRLLLVDRVSHDATTWKTMPFPRIPRDLTPKAPAESLSAGASLGPGKVAG